MNAQATMPPAAAGASASRRGGENLIVSFSVASTVVLLGVLSAWVWVKRAGGESDAIAADLALDALPTAVLDTSRDAVATLLDQADVAFAAGRIVEPRFDNALYFYRTVLEQAPTDTQARAGVERVVLWLAGQMDLAVDAADFERAEALATRIVELRPGDAQADARLDRIARIRTLTSEAAAQRSAGQLAAAALTYRRLLALDAENRPARDGLRAAVAGLVDAGRRAVDEGREDDARARLEEARRADPGASGVSALAARLASLDRATAEEARTEALAGIRDAIRQGSVLGEGAADVFERIASFERNWPDAETGAALREDARLALVERTRTALGGGDFGVAERALARAGARGVESAVLSGLQDELAWRRYLADFDARRWTLASISDLTVLEQAAPAYPDRAQRLSDGGWVDLEFTVGEDGTVRDPVVLDASSRMFVANSIEALERWRFEARRVGGRPVPVRAVLRFSFRNG